MLDLNIIFGSGLQFAGGHLRQLQKALKSVNVGVILGEAAKRAKRTVGLSNGNQLGDVVHPKLALQGSLTAKVMMADFNLRRRFSW